MSRRQRQMCIGDGPGRLLSDAVATIVWIALVTTGNPDFNGLWGLIALGYLFNRKEKKAQRQKGYTSFTDRISNRLWIP